MRRSTNGGDDADGGAGGNDGNNGHGNACAAADDGDGCDGFDDEVDVRGVKYRLPKPRRLRTWPVL